MYTTNYDRSCKKWFAFYYDEDNKLQASGDGETKEDAFVNLGWNLCYKLKVKNAA